VSLPERVSVHEELGKSELSALKSHYFRQLFPQLKNFEILGFLRPIVLPADYEITLFSLLALLKVAVRFKVRGV